MLPHLQSINMDPQLLMPSPATDFNFDSTPTSPYATAPSSPKIVFPNFFYSAPTSPISLINTHVADDFPARDSFSSCEQLHEQKNEDSDTDAEFAFDFSGQLEQPLISAADELFHGGKIKPLEPPPPFRSSMVSPRSSRKKISKPSSEAFQQTPREQPQNPSPRGRERTTATATGHQVSRSLSPMRVSDILSDHQKDSTSRSSSPFGFMWYNKWNLKNLLLFRSTSEGSATVRKGDQDVKNSSFRSSDGGGSVVGSSRRMKRKVSAHEMHYTANRAVAEDMRRKTFLPYNSGLLGCLGFSRNIHEVSSRGRR